MAKSDLGRWIKCLLLSGTVLIFMGGIALLSVGIWAILQKVGSVQELLGNAAYTYSSITLITSGAIITLISFLGCCGTYHEKKVKLGLYFTVLLMIFIILLTGGIMIFMFKDKVQVQLRPQMEYTVPHYFLRECVTEAWDAIQIHFQCCGLAKNNRDSYLIWEDNEVLKNESLVVPISCCKDLENIAPCQKDPKVNAHMNDCYVVVKEYFIRNSNILGGTGIGIAGIVLIEMVLTCGLCLEIKTR